MLVVNNLQPSSQIIEAVQLCQIEKSQFFGVSFEYDLSTLYCKSIYSTLEEATDQYISRFNTSGVRLDFERSAVYKKRLKLERYNIATHEVLAQYYNTEDRFSFLEKYKGFAAKKLLNTYFDIQHSDIATHCLRMILPTKIRVLLKELISVEAKHKLFIVKTSGKYGFWIYSDNYWRAL